MAEFTRNASAKLPWGLEGGSVALEYPKDWPEAKVIWPDLANELKDYHKALNAALEEPEGSLKLDRMARTGSKVAIVVDDPSRWTPVREALPVVLERLRNAGVSREGITICVGVGRHRAVTEEAMKRRVGAEVAEAYRCASPPVDDLAAYDDLGATAGGLPVRVYRPVAEADLRILIGSVLPHLQAGFGGGYKLIFPGTSHRSTLGALHRQGIGPEWGDGSRLLGGDVASNPMRRAIAEAAETLGPSLSISHLLGGPGQVLDVRAGHPIVVQEALSTEARRRYRAAEAEPADVVVAGNYPWPGDPMQSFKVLLQHRSACRVGGVLVGLFWTDAAEIDRSFPLGLLKGIAVSGRSGAWVARHGLAVADRLAGLAGSSAAFLIHWARELVVDRTVLVYAPPLFERLGPRLGPVRLFNDLPTLWRAAAESLPGQKAPGSVRIFPCGGLTYAGGKETGDRSRETGEEEKRTEDR